MLMGTRTVLLPRGQVPHGAQYAELFEALKDLQPCGNEAMVGVTGSDTLNGT